MPLFGPPNVQKLKEKHNIEGLLKALGYEKNRDVREAAAKALGEIGDAQAVEPLIATLKNAEMSYEGKDLVCSIAEALGKIGDARAVEPLIAVLKNDEVAGHVRQVAAYALGDLGDVKAVEPLIAAVDDRDIYVVIASIRALGDIGDGRAIEPIFAALDRNFVHERDVGKAVVGALREIGGDRGIESLIAVVEKKRKRGGEDAAHVCAAAVEALVKIGDARAVEPLIDILDTNIDYNARIAAARMLGKSGGTQVVEALTEFLEKSESRGVSAELDSYARAVVAETLGDIDDERAKEALHKAMFSRSERVRKAAAGKFEQIATPEEKRALSLNKQGVELDDSGKSGEAIRCFDEALTVLPWDGAIWSNKGLALLHLKRPEEAIICFDKSIELGQGQFYLDLGNKGSALLQLGRFPEAEECYAQALENYIEETGDKEARNAAPVLLGMGESLDGQGRYEEAIAYYERVLAINPNASNVRSKLNAARHRLA